MIGIKDFEMPDTCYDCDCKAYGLRDGYYCPLTRMPIVTSSEFIHQRDESCPLLEVSDAE